MDTFINPTPQQIPPQNNHKKWIIIAVIVLALGALAYILVGSNLFKGALYIDETMKEKKLASQSVTVEQELKQTDESVVLDCDVVVAGAGTGGIAAAIASAREGVKTCLIEETDWLGGMMTSAGVAAIDGRPDSPSGIFHEIIEEVEAYYVSRGKQKEIHDCAVSYLCFEPHVGDFVLKGMVAKESNLKIYYNATIDKVYREKNKITGVGFEQDSVSYIAEADVTIDATEYGDLMYLADIDYDLGLDPDTTESLANDADQCIQPLTYVAILQKQSAPAIIERPTNYNREAYRCTIKSSVCPDSQSIFDMNRLLTYGKMPNNKLMINTPSHSFGNDFNATTENLENYSREAILEEAKDYSRGYIYFIQTELGMEKYALYDEFGTDDKFAKTPYIRESRRLKGVKRLVESDIVKNGGGQRSDLATDAIAIGDYPIDLHFCKTGKGDIFKPIAPYQIPYGLTVPLEVDGFLAADKNISVTHITNGTTRLQPVTMSVGQAVGIAAAMASQSGIEPRNIDTELLQKKLLDNGSNLFFFTDLQTQHWAYKHVASLAVKGLISGYDDFTFRPDNTVNQSDLLKIFKVYLISKNQSAEVMNDIGIEDNPGKSVIREDMIGFLYRLLEVTDKLQQATSYPDLNFSDITAGNDVYTKAQALVSLQIIDDKNQKFRPKDNLTRAEAMVLMARALDVIFAKVER